MNKNSFAIIGCEHAHISVFIDEMLELGYECIGIYESENKSLRQTISQKYHIPIVEEIETLLKSKCKVIGSSAINYEKIDIVELCEQHGKHIMLDKPAVTNRDGYERLEKVIGRGRIQVGLMLTERFNPIVYTLKKKMDEGLLGQILSVGMRKPHLMQPANRPQWFFSKEQSGGIVIDLFIHDLDLIRWLTGAEIDSIEGFMFKNVLPEHPTFYDLASLQILMKNHVLANLYADWHTPGKSWTWGDGRIFVVGTKGNAELRLYGDPLVSQDGLMLCVTNQEPYRQIDIESPPYSLMEDFIRRIDGEPGLITHDDILIATEATLQADERVKIILNQ